MVEPSRIIEGSKVVSEKPDDAKNVTVISPQVHSQSKKPMVLTRIR
jgi:hypothetical protein